MKRKPKTGKHTPEKIEQFWRMRAEGWAYKEIAKQLKVSYWTCVDWGMLKTQVKTNMRMAEKYGINNKKGFSK